MKKSKPDDKYTKEAKKLLSWWQESLKEQWQHPDMLHAWIDALKNQPSGTGAAQGARHATAKRPHAANADGDDAQRALRAELVALRTRVSKLERELRALRGTVSKPTSVSKPKPVSKRKPRK